MKRFRFAITLSLLLLSQNSIAALSLDRMIVYFNPDQIPRQDIVVTNPDNENLYLQTEVYKVTNPGTEKEERLRITDPKELNLLATPQKTVVPPNSRRTVRMVSLKTPKDVEQVYRVTFRPVVGDQEATQTAIKLLIAYQALIFIRPENPEFKVSSKVTEGKVVFQNTGNMNVVLRNGRYCSSNKEDSCTSLDTGTRIYAGGSWEMDLPEHAKKGQGYIQFGLFDGEFERAQKFTL